MATVDGDWTYAYDATGQLSHARFVARNAEVPDQDLEYHYDAVGNRTFTVSNGLRTDYKVNSLNQYTGVGGLVLIAISMATSFLTVPTDMSMIHLSDS